MTASLSGSEALAFDSQVCTNNEDLYGGFGNFAQMKCTRPLAERRKLLLERMRRRAICVVSGVALAGCNTVVFIRPVTDWNGHAEDWPLIESSGKSLQIPVAESFGFPLNGGQYAICLSGGGYRAALFHLGVLWKLNEMGLFSRAGRVVGVSGGAVIAGVIGMNWGKLNFEEGKAKAFVPEIAEPILRLTSSTIDVGAIAKGLLTPSAAGTELSKYYDRLLFKGKNLNDLPGRGKGPQIIFLASDERAGSTWYISKHAMGSRRFGYFAFPDLSIATAVASSSAFPPILAPVSLDARNAEKKDLAWTPIKLTLEEKFKVQTSLYPRSEMEAKRIQQMLADMDDESPEQYERLLNSFAVGKQEESDRRFGLMEPNAHVIRLEDGGVLSNTGFEVCDRTTHFIVSSAAVFPDHLISVPHNWISSLAQTTNLIFARAEEASFDRIDAMKATDDCNINKPVVETDPARCGMGVALTRRSARHSRISDEYAVGLQEVSIPTRLKAVPLETQHRLVNWGYLAVTESIGEKPESEGDHSLPYPDEDYRKDIVCDFKLVNANSQIVAVKTCKKTRRQANR